MQRRHDARSDRYIDSGQVRARRKGNWSSGLRFQNARVVDRNRYFFDYLTGFRYSLFHNGAGALRVAAEAGWVRDSNRTHGSADGSEHKVRKLRNVRLRTHVICARREPEDTVLSTIIRLD